jgi:hypothetical protein
MEKGRDADGQEPETVTLPGINHSKRYKIPCQASPNSMDERQGGKPGDIKEIRVIDTLFPIEGHLVANSFEYTEA